MPLSFVIVPASITQQSQAQAKKYNATAIVRDERDNFLEVCKASNDRNIWIGKSNAGAKGNGLDIEYVCKSDTMKLMFNSYTNPSPLRPSQHSQRHPKPSQVMPPQHIPMQAKPSQLNPVPSFTLFILQEKAFLYLLILKKYLNQLMENTKLMSSKSILKIHYCWMDRENLISGN